MCVVVAAVAICLLHAGVLLVDAQLGPVPAGAEQAPARFACRAHRCRGPSTAPAPSLPARHACPQYVPREKGPSLLTTSGQYADIIKGGADKFAADAVVHFINKVWRGRGLPAPPLRMPSRGQAPA